MIVLLLILISGCSTTTKIKCEPVERTPLEAPDPAALNLQNVEFIVVNRENVEEVFNMLEERGIEPVFFSLTGADYKALAMNMQELKRLILEQRLVIKLYRDYYEGKKNDK